MKLIPMIYTAIVLTSCCSIPHRTITITDKSNRPIRGAGARAPYPILLRNILFTRDAPSANSTDSQGRYEIYDTTPGQHYVLTAVGYADKSISFPTDNRQTYVLQRNR